MEDFYWERGGLLCDIDELYSISMGNEWNKKGGGLLCDIDELSSIAIGNEWNKKYMILVCNQF